MNFIQRLKKPKFDCDGLKRQILTEAERALTELAARSDEIYALSVCFYPDDTTYMSYAVNSISHLKEMLADDPTEEAYYRYCENEWEAETVSETLSEPLRKCRSSLWKWGAADETMLEECVEEHNRSIIDTCIDAMLQLKSTKLYSGFPQLALNVFVNEYLSNDEQLSIYKRLNGEAAAEGYKVYLYG